MRPSASGMAVSERKSEHRSVKMIVRPTSPIQVEISVRPPRTSGRNTMIEVAVEHTTAGSTSREPTSAARRGPSPFWRWRKMLSSTTTALSTSMPTASISPIIERMLSVRPVKRSSAAAASSENGMARPTTSVVTQLRRKTNRITVASAPPIMPAWSSPESELSISSPVLVNGMTRVPPVALEARELEVHAHLGWIHAVELALGDARHPAQRVCDVPVQQLVVVREVAPRRNAALEHRDVGGALAVHLDHIHVGRELVADSVELLARLDAQRPDVLAPVELDVDLGLIRGRSGVDVTHARQRGERLLGGPGDLLLDLRRQRVGVWDDDLEPRELHLRKERQGQARRRERPQHHDAQQHHARRDRAAQAPAREIHGWIAPEQRRMGRPC